MVEARYTLPRQEIGRFQMPALIIGVIGLVLLAIGIFIQRPAIGFHSYLLGYVFWIGVTLGSLAVLMLQYLITGGWGVMMRRELEAATRTLPLFVLLFIPIILGMGYLYEWSHPEAIRANAVIARKSGYLKPWFFILRAVIYFAVWGALAFFLNRWSAEQDRTADPRYLSNANKLSGPGVVFFVLTVTLATTDWIMSLDPEWYSTIWGLIFTINFVLTGFTFAILVMYMLSEREPLSGILRREYFHDWGKLLLAFVMVWAYFNFSQYLLIWSGNLPEENKWFLLRSRFGWGWIGVLIAVFHFAVPFALLLSRDLKRNSPRLVAVAMLVFFMRLVDLFWLIKPQLHYGDTAPAFNISWMDFVAPIGIGGVWVAYFLWELQRRPLLPANDPKLAQEMAVAARHHH